MKTKRKNKPGAGRPVVQNKRNPITVMITKNEKEAIEMLAKDLEKSLSGTMRYLLTSGILFGLGCVKTQHGYRHGKLLDPKYENPPKEYAYQRAWSYWGIEDINTE